MSKAGSIRRVKWAVSFGVFLFALIHWFYDPYRVVERVSFSDDQIGLESKERSRELAVLKPVSNEWYRVAVDVRWDSVIPDTPEWKTARVLFASYDERGRWIPSKHAVCSVEGTGRGQFSDVFQLPPNTASTRLMLQHQGVSGRIDLLFFSIEQVEVKLGTIVLFRSLQLVWVCIAVWAVFCLRLLKRRGGVAVVVAAGVIAVGMILPEPVVSEVPERAVDLVRPLEPLVGAPAKKVAADPTQGDEAVAPRVTDRLAEFVHNGGTVAVERFREVDYHFWGHVGLFLILGVAAGAWFVDMGHGPRGLVTVFAAGVLYAVAAELLQVTELTRMVRATDIGSNILGWSVGLFFALAVKWIRLLHPHRPQVVSG